MKQVLKSAFVFLVTIIVSYSQLSLEAQVLPWVEDFSDFREGLDTTKWVSNRAIYINDHLAIRPPSVGIASFDGRDEEGNQYTPSIGGNDLLAFDVLTSQTIDLSSYTSEVISLSFEVQYGGAGGHFRGSTVTDVFHCEGLGVDGDWITLTEFVRAGADDEDTFAFVGIVLDQRFLHSDFRVRFWNSSNRALGYRNMWHLDYITIEPGQALRYALDISFSERPNSPLMVYQSMPFSQFYARMYAFLDDSFDVKLYNHFPYNEKLLSDELKITEANSGDVLIDDLRFLRRFPEVEIDQNVIAPGAHRFTNPSYRDTLESLFLGLDPYEEYEFVFNYSYFQDEENVARQPEYIDNNMTEVVVNFKDYFAYDDGTAEAIRGVLVDPSGTSNPSFAIEFESVLNDDLIGFDYLQPLANNPANSRRVVDVVVWIDTLDDEPDLRIPNVTIENSTADIPQYQRILFSELGVDPFAIPHGKFYIGFQITNFEMQYEVELGFDVSNNTFDKIFRKEHHFSPWARYPERRYSGTLMLRPVMANNTDVTTSSSAVKKALNINIYPNPAGNEVFFDGLENISGPKSLTIYDLRGLILWSGITNDHLDVSFLSKGVYIFAFRDNRNNIVSTQKVTILK